MNKENDHTEVQTIRLYREPIGLKEQNFYFATDYFDFLVAEEKKINDTFGSIMNLHTAAISREETAAQSYTLYFSQKMYEKYESSEECKYKGSPFEDKNLNFLSVIQVHIMPEVLRRMECSQKSNDMLAYNEGIVLEPFFSDLYGVVSNFCKNQSNDKIIFRIYEVLSAGDIAIVLKSNHPKTSFELSSQIRKRVAAEVGTDGKNQASQWTIYKTYTLLTIKKKLSGDMENYDDAGKFIIRGCYSCKYWANQSRADKVFPQKVELPKEMGGLNGRYDFLLELTEQDFYEIYPFIITYKKRQEQIPENAWERVKGQGKYLVYLLENDYISFINERYLLMSADVKKENISEKRQADEVSNNIIIDAALKDIEDLAKENVDKIDQLIKRYEALDIDEILIMQQNTQHFFWLLRKHIAACYGLNQQSDTRGFVKGIMKLLDTVIASIEVYKKFYDLANKENRVQIAELMEDYIRECVYAIDNYMTHIRNNNMQSLQTPNYDIESNMGMEKVLIGYGEYLSKLISLYPREEKFKKTFCPIIVPDLQKTDICVEVMFPEGGASKWEEEKNIRDQKKQHCYLLVIGSSTISELGDIPVFTAMLFHEIAHQFRYEERKERNRVLAHIIVREQMEQLVTEIIHEMRMDYTGSYVGVNISQILLPALEEEIMDWFEKEIYEKEASVMEAPLSYFNPYFRERLHQFILTWSNKNDIEDSVNKFLMNLQCIVNIYEDSYKKNLEILQNILKSDKVEIINIQKATFGLVIKCTYDLQNPKTFKLNQEMSTLFDEIDTLDWSANMQNVKFEECWRQFDFKETEDDAGTVQAIYEIWRQLAVCLEDMTFQAGMQQLKNRNNNESQATPDIMSLIYKKACKKWSKENLQYGSLKNDKDVIKLSDYRAFTIMGRKLGIDNETKDNEKLFRNIMYTYCYHLDKKPTYAVEVYREVKSDMFMYSIMDLSPFAYLNLVAIIISEPDLIRWFNLYRMVIVLCVMEINKEKNTEEQIFPEYLVVCKKILKGMKEYSSRILGDNHDVSKAFGNILMESDRDNEKQLYWKIKKILNDKGCWDTQKEQEPDVWQKVQHIKKIARVYSRLLLTGKKYIHRLLYDIQCFEDYHRGEEYLKDLKKRMNTSNSFIKMLLSTCEQSKHYIEQEHYKTGIVRDADLNEQSIELLLSLYYDRRIRNTRKEETYNENQDGCSE